MDKTKEYIYKHKAAVMRRMHVIISELEKRAINHDNSKLKEPELSGWRAMDNEPRYPYGSEEYAAKLKKYQWLLEQHWKKNRHHPEYWKLNPFERNKDLIDVIETVVDWLSYKNEILSIDQALKLIKQQTKRYKFSRELTELIENTIINYFFFPGGVKAKNELEKQQSELANLLKDVIDVFDKRAEKYSLDKQHILDIEV